jgi:hypothetical protein
MYDILPSTFADVQIPFQRRILDNVEHHPSKD